VIHVAHRRLGRSEQSGGNGWSGGFTCQLATGITCHGHGPEILQNLLETILLN
jgi:hypothetical protein